MFKNLGLIFDVPFLIFGVYVPTLSSIRYMLKNKLHIYIRDACITYEGRIETLPLLMNNYFLINRWAQAPQDFSYTEMATYETTKEI